MAYVTEIENEEYMTPPQLKRLLGLSLPTQAKMRAKQGNFANDPNPLPFIKIGRRVLYKASSIDAWIKRQEERNLLKGDENV